MVPLIGYLISYLIWIYERSFREGLCISNVYGGYDDRVESVFCERSGVRNLSIIHE